MNSIKIVTIIGARPQFIKAATVSREIAKNNDIEEIIIHTGQNYDYELNEVFFEDLQVHLDRRERIPNFMGKRGGDLTDVGHALAFTDFGLHFYAVRNVPADTDVGNFVVIVCGLG